MNKTNVFVLAAILSASMLSFSGQDRGGGDIACEGRIKLIKEDLINWIKQGGYKNLDLKSRGSSKQYADRMLQEIHKTSIECVGKGDPGFPVLVYGVAKTCAIDMNTNQNHMTCDFSKVSNYSDEALYKQIHHEYATAAGFEKPSAGDSDYEISNQLTNYLEQQLVPKLVVKQNSPNLPNLDRVREAMKFELSRSEVSTYGCAVEGEGTVLNPFYYVGELDKMTNVRKSYIGDGKYAYFEYVFSYVDKNDIKYEERITTKDNRVLDSVQLTILRKQKVNLGTVEDPEIKIDYVPTGNIHCLIRTAKL